MAKQTKAKSSKKQINPFEPEEKKKVTKILPGKRSGSIFEKAKAESYEEKNEWAEDHEEKGETEEQIEDEMKTGEADADVYTEEGRHSKIEEEDELDAEDVWQEAWSQGAAGKGKQGKYEEQKPSVTEKKVKETVKGLKKRK